jgi:hypothetical protein
MTNDVEESIAGRLLGENVRETPATVLARLNRKQDTPTTSEGTTKEVFTYEKGFRVCRRSSLPLRLVHLALLFVASRWRSKSRVSTTIATSRSGRSSRRLLRRISSTSRSRSFLRLRPRTAMVRTGRQKILSAMRWGICLIDLPRMLSLPRSGESGNHHAVRGELVGMTTCLVFAIEQREWLLARCSPRRSSWS